MIVSAKGLDARPLNTGTQDKSSRPVVMVQPTLHTTAPTSVPVKSMQIITKCGEDLYKDSQPSAVASKTPTTTQGTSIFSDSYQHLKIIVNGKVQNYLVPVKKPSSAESEPVIAYGPFDFLGGKMTSAAVNVSQTGSAATSVKYPDSTPASTNKLLVVQNRVSPTGAVSISLSKPILTQNTTANQLPPKPDLLANKPVVVTTKHSAGTPASTSFVNLVSIFPSTSYGTGKAPSQLPAASNVLAAYQQNSLSRSSDKPESSAGTFHSSGSLVSRPAKSSVPKPCNLEAAPSTGSSVYKVQGKATALNPQNTGLEIGGTLVKGQSKITYNVNPTSSMAKAYSYTCTGTTCSKAQKPIVAVKDAAGKVIGFQNVLEQTKHTGLSVPSQGAGAVAASSAAMRPFPCVPTVVSSYSTAVPKLTTVHMVNVPFQQKPSEVSDSQHSLKIDSVYSLAKPTPETMKCVKTDTSADSGAPGPSLSACDKDSTANSHLVPEQPTFLEVIDVVPCKVVMRKISQNFQTKITKKNVNKLGTFNIRKRPWSKLVREHLSSYYREEKFAKIDLNPVNVYRILQESPLTVVAMPRKAVQKDQTDDTVKGEHKPQTARKRGYGRINRSRSGKIVDSVPKKRKKSSENNEDPVRLSRPRPLLMSALRSTSPLTDCSAAVSIAASQATVCSVAKSTAPRQSSMSSVAKSAETRQMPMVSATQSKPTHQTPVFSVTQSTATSKMPVCSVVHVTSAAALCPPKYKSIINPAVVSPTKGIINPTILSPNKGVVNPSIMSHDKCVNSPNALKPVQHQTPAPVSQENKERSSACHIVPALPKMSCDETKKVSLPFGPCVTAGFTGKAVLGKEGSEPENYLILKTSQSCYFVPVGKNAYVVPISKATEVVQSSEKPVMSTACFGDVTSVSESRAMKVASQVTTMPILTAEAGAPRMTMKATRYHDIGKTASPKTDDTRSQTSSPRKRSWDGDSSSKSETNSVSFSGVRVKAEPITTGYPGDPENEPPRLSPAPSPIPGVRIKTENDSETDDAWSGTDMPNDEAPAEEEATCVPFKSVADLYRSRQDHGQYQPTANYQATREDDEATLRAERIRKLRELMKSKEKKCDKARQSWSGDQTEKLIKEFDDI